VAECAADSAAVSAVVQWEAGSGDVASPCAAVTDAASPAWADIAVALRAPASEGVSQQSADPATAEDSTAATASGAPDLAGAPAGRGVGEAAVGAGQ
jgi:hypothetical protein